MDGTPPDGADPLAWARWLWSTDHEGVATVREAVWSALLVAMLGVALFSVSGVWPPLVAVESGSMEPHMSRGDLVFVMDHHRFDPPAATANTGVVTYRAGERAGYRRFGASGDVIVFQPPDRRASPIIHRARFWVNDSENWYDKANPDHLDGQDCASVPNCPAPHAGFITKGDANDDYDQVTGISDPVQPGWVRGRAVVRVPLLGEFRLAVR